MNQIAESPIERLAEDLYNAEQNRRPIEPLTDSFPELSLEDAYRIQRMNIDRRLEEGEKIMGHKVGLTSRAMQELFNVNEPDYGHLLDSMFHDAAVPLNLDELIDPQIEVEPAFFLGKALNGPGITAEDVLNATDYIRVCFEVIDSRIINWRIKLQDTVADNGSSSRVVLGKKKIKPRALVLDDLETTLEVDGVTVETGSTSAILGHPANGVAWLANKFAEFEISFGAGHIVLPGTCTRSVRIGGHKTVKGRIEGMGEVTMTLAGKPAVVNQS
jgi:2-keto-4-pentenoate hydratase